jgi:hypothetical protein
MNILNSGRFSMGSSGAGILKKLISMHDQDNHFNFFLSISKLLFCKLGRTWGTNITNTVIFVSAVKSSVCSGWLNFKLQKQLFLHCTNVF